MVESINPNERGDLRAVTKSSDERRLEAISFQVVLIPIPYDLLLERLVNLPVLTVCKVALIAVSSTTGEFDLISESLSCLLSPRLEFFTSHFEFVVIVAYWVWEWILRRPVVKALELVSVEAWVEDGIRFSLLV